MPITKRCISPIDVSRHRLPPEIRENELECVANGTLANLVRQMSSLSKHAENIFGELYREAVKVEHKTSTFQNRIERISSKVTLLDSNMDEVSLKDLHLRKPFKSNISIDQQSLSRQTMPVAMAECYACCDKPPDLDKLNVYRTDGKSGLKFYTDPDYFFELWRQEMLKDADQYRKVNKTKGGQSVEKKHKTKDKNRTLKNHQTKQLTSADISKPQCISSTTAMANGYQQQQQQQQSDCNSTIIKSNVTSDYSVFDWRDQRHDHHRFVEQTSDDVVHYHLNNNSNVVNSSNVQIQQQQQQQQSQFDSNRLINVGQQNYGERTTRTTTSSSTSTTTTTTTTTDEAAVSVSDLNYRQIDFLKRTPIHSYVSSATSSTSTVAFDNRNPSSSSSSLISNYRNPVESSTATSTATTQLVAQRCCLSGNVVVDSSAAMTSVVSTNHGNHENPINLLLNGLVKATSPDSTECDGSDRSKANCFNTSRPVCSPPAPPPPSFQFVASGNGNNSVAEQYAAISKGSKICDTVNPVAPFSASTSSSQPIPPPPLNHENFAYCDQKTAIDDDTTDDLLPPPPPPLYDPVISSNGQHNKECGYYPNVISMQAIPSAKTSSSIIAPPPPPPPPPLLFKGSSITNDIKPTLQATSACITKCPAPVPVINDRLEMLRAIREQNFRLKKVSLCEERRKEKDALSRNSHDVAAILRKGMEMRMERVMGGVTSDSSSDNDEQPTKINVGVDHVEGGGIEKALSRDDDAVGHAVTGSSDEWED